MNRPLGNIEMQFANIVWTHSPLSTNELCKICEKELSWKRTTTYTVLKKLCNEGLFCYEGGTVRVIKDKEDYISEQSVDYVEQNFNGSLPGFVAAFTKCRGLSEKEVAKLLEMINSFKGGENDGI